MAVVKKATFESPLTTEHKAKIDDALGILKKLEEQIKRAKLAGLDVAEYEARRIELDQKLRQIKQAYWPMG
jgi:hypothetical protein